MALKPPALVRAEVLARTHYGLPPVRESLTGWKRGVHQSVHAKLEDGGFTLDDQLTEMAYLELAEVSRRLNRV